MKIEHIYPEDNAMIATHVAMIKRYTTGTEADGLPDIVHVHGCWKYQVVKSALKAYREGARLVFSPHGGLEPWILNERRMTEKLSKTLLWQRRLAEHAYVVIAHSTIESDNLGELAWNPRVETIRNAVVTNSITEEAMARQTLGIYRKVMDSNTLELMSDDSRSLMAMMLKAAITGDRRWVTLAHPDSLELISRSMPDNEWRNLLIYAEHENVRQLIVRGADLLGMRMPAIDPGRIKSYLPTGYQQPQTKATQVVEIVEEMNRSLPTLYHLVALDKALRSGGVDDDKLIACMEEKGMQKYFSRILQLLKEQTLLDDGFLPCAPLDDKQTQSLRNLLYNHLKI